MLLIGSQVCQKRWGYIPRPPWITAPGGCTPMSWERVYSKRSRGTFCMKASRSWNCEQIQPTKIRAHPSNAFIFANTFSLLKVHLTLEPGLEQVFIASKSCSNFLETAQCCACESGKVSKEHPQGSQMFNAVVTKVERLEDLTCWGLQMSDTLRVTIRTLESWCKRNMENSKGP